MNLSNILQKFRDMSPSVREQGKLYEKFIRQYLRVVKTYSNLKTVWLWTDFPYRDALQDVGIDLVAQTEEGDFWAIQCKFYSNDATVAKGDIDSFLAASSMKFLDEKGVSHSFVYRQVFTTTDLSANAKETLEKQSVPVGVVTPADMDDSGIDWDKFWDEFDSKTIQGEESDAPSNVLAPLKELRPHQKEALDDVIKGFETADRGQLLMACGTGKTFTSLRISEKFVGCGGFMLYLVPSLSLLAQTLREWSIDSKIRIQPLLVCSDNEIHEQDTRRKKALKEDEVTGSALDLAQPATTDPGVLFSHYRRLVEHEARENSDRMIVVFSTYQSIEVIKKAQKNFNLPEFDLIICDEAHRTTGVSLGGKNRDESAFMQVHSNENIRAKKRLYMTATPRVYRDTVKKTADENDAVLCSMDDKTLYGEVFHCLSFGKAVSSGLLTDYRVIVLSIQEEYARKFISELSLVKNEEDSDLYIDDVSKILGCWRGLCKQSTYYLPNGELSNDFSFDPEPVKRAVAFCATIKNSRDFVTPAFEELTKRWSQTEEMRGLNLVKMKHVDGSFGAAERKERIDWLKAEPEEGTCHILSNVRCLSEGVDVPNLDAVLFLSPRNSEVDVVQALGRVMRKAEGKKYGYIILPVVIPPGKKPEDVLDDNKRYKVVWQVLQSLRAHDDRFNVWINQLKFNEDLPPGESPIILGTPPKGDNPPGTDVVSGNPKGDGDTQIYLDFKDASKAIIAQIVKKCGKRDYLEEWAKDIANIAKNQIDQILEKLKSPTPEQEQAFNAFLAHLQSELNPAVDRDQAIEMLTQHIVTKPVFDALFENYAFVKKNVISKAIQDVLDTFNTQQSPEELKRLEDFNREIRYRVEGIHSTSGKQQVITKLYEQFFTTAFPKLAEKLGIVYTPIEVVDFIIKSVDYLLKKHFKKSLGNRNVEILDPFTGTGTFITRILQAGLIPQTNLTYKYNREIHANEIVLLAYYIAAINIEEAFHGAYSAQRKEGANLPYKVFPGLILTDTFQMEERELPENVERSEYVYNETEGELEEFVNPENSDRILNQRRAKIQVIVGNPPYSIGQKSANDNNQNQQYPRLDKRVKETYATESNVNNKNSLYDSYIKAFRWASDRIGKEGIIGFVTNSGWLDKTSADGLRACFEREFTEIYVFNLRGSIRGRIGDDAKREGQNVFNIMTGVAITILIKDPTYVGPTRIYYHDIGDYLSREQKLAIIKSYGSVDFVPWEEIRPNRHHDWINLRSEEYLEFYPLGDKKGKDDDSLTEKDCEPRNNTTVFEPMYSRGIETGRDSWVYNFSSDSLISNIRKTISYFNAQYDSSSGGRDMDAKHISWSSSLEMVYKRQERLLFDEDSIVTGTYRPYVKMNLYTGKGLIHRPAIKSNLFPTAKHPNLAICLQGSGARRDFTCLIVDTIPCLDMLEKTQCFPLYYYTPVDSSKSAGLVWGTASDYVPIVDGYERHDAITQEFLDTVRKKYGQQDITREDVFYYVYGILHSPEYRQKYGADLKKILARIPLVKDYWNGFYLFSQAGRKLAELHLNYDTPTRLESALKRISSKERGYHPIKCTLREPEQGFLNVIDEGVYQVNKMTFGKDAKGKENKSTIIYNENFRIEDIPLEAYDYIVNGKSAIEWVMERYQVKTDDRSGIVNNPNHWDATNPGYMWDLLQSVITVSLHTVSIVKMLPKVELD